MTTAVTGASGPHCRTTAEPVLQSVDPREVVLTTRRPQALADLAARGVDERRLDVTGPGTLTAGCAVAHRLLVVSTDAVGARLGPQRAAATGRYVADLVASVGAAAREGFLARATSAAELDPPEVAVVERPLARVLDGGTATPPPQEG